VYSGILGVEVFARQQMARREPEDLKIAGGFRRTVQRRCRLTADVLRGDAVECRCRREPLAKGIRDGDQQVKCEDNSAGVQTLCSDSMVFP
jgi:hypothetical protein